VRNWIQHENSVPRNRLPRIAKKARPNGTRNQGRPLKKLPDVRYRNGQHVAQLHDNDDDDDDYDDDDDDDDDVL